MIESSKSVEPLTGRRIYVPDVAANIDLLLGEWPMSSHSWIDTQIEVGKVAQLEVFSTLRCARARTSQGRVLTVPA